MEATNVERLFASGVLIEREGDVGRSPEFESAIEAHEATMATGSRDELRRLIRRHVDEEIDVEPLVELGERDPLSIAELCALSDRLDADATEWLALLPVLRLFRTDAVPTDGVPDPFVPVTGELLPAFSAMYSRLLVYIWLDDCPPCDSLKERLESIFDRPMGMLLFAVYGPDHAAFLDREYDVTAGPAILFVQDGAVDSRLYGDQDERVIEREVDRLLE